MLYVKTRQGQSKLLVKHVQVHRILEGGPGTEGIEGDALFTNLFRLSAVLIQQA